MIYRIRNSVFPLANAIFITGCLLLMMYAMVKVSDPELQIKSNIKLPAMQLPDRDEDLIIGPIKPIKPEQVKEKPKIKNEVEVIDIDPVKGVIGTGPIIDKKITIETTYQSSQLVLAFSLPPVYPRGALQRGLEGYVVVGFDVNESGAVINPYIAEANPPKVFNRSAIKAIQKFKYKPKQVDGKFIKTQGLQYMFTYKLDS